MKNLLANPARVLCVAVLAMIGTFAGAIWASGALDHARPNPAPSFQPKEPCS